MVIIQVDLNNTQLKDRTLWYDGESIVSEDVLMNFITNGVSTKGLFVETLTPAIKQYNMHVGKDEKLTIKDSTKPFEYEWNIPQEYKDIDIVKHVVGKLNSLEYTDISDEEFFARGGRIIDELGLYKKLGLMPVLATLIYIINTLIENNVVWGVGRGSSVSSYVLYLLEVHDIDSFKYGLNIEEFLRTE